MFSKELNNQLDRLAKESERERLKHERHFDLMQEILRLGRNIMPTNAYPTRSAMDLAKLLKFFNAKVSNGNNPWLNVCRVVIASAKQNPAYKDKDFSFIEGYAGYLRFFDNKLVSTQGRPNIKRFVATFNDPEFGTGLGAIKDRDTKDNRIGKLATQSTVPCTINGLPQEIFAALERQAEAIRGISNADGSFNVMTVRNVVGQIDSLIRLLPKTKARTTL